MKKLLLGLFVLMLSVTLNAQIKIGYDSQSKLLFKRGIMWDLVVNNDTTEYYYLEHALDVATLKNGDRNFWVIYDNRLIIDVKAPKCHTDDIFVINTDDFPYYTRIKRDHVIGFIVGYLTLRINDFNKTTYYNMY